jgi:hypothetical protein
MGRRSASIRSTQSESARCLFESEVCPQSHSCAYRTVCSTGVKTEVAWTPSREWSCVWEGVEGWGGVGWGGGQDLMMMRRGYWSCLSGRSKWGVQLLLFV